MDATKEQLSIDLMGLAVRMENIGNRLFWLKPEKANQILMSAKLAASVAEDLRGENC